MPETVAQAPPAAPAAPSTPAPVAPPAPPAPPSTPTPPPAAAVPSAPAVPAKFDAKSSPTPPDPATYPQGADGNDQFMADNGAWLLEHPDLAAKLDLERRREGEDFPVEAPVEVPVAPEAAVDPNQPVDAKPQPDATVAAATPAVIEEWTAKSPKLKEAFAENPELQGAIMGMARDLEGAQKVLDVVATPEEAITAVSTAHQMYSLQANWMLAAEDPEMVGPAFENTRKLFMETDANGNPVMENGQPKMAPDYALFEGKFAASAISRLGGKFDSDMAAIQARLGGSYPNDDARAADETALEHAGWAKKAVDYVLSLIGNGEQAGPSLPKLPANATPEQIEFQKQLEEREKANAAKEGRTTKESRKAAREAMRKEVQGAYEGSIFDLINTDLAAMKERGEYLPDFVVNDKWINPQNGKVSNLTAFQVKIYQQLNEKINKLHGLKILELEALGAAGKQARIDLMKEKVVKYGRKLIQDEVARIQKGIKGAQPKPPGTVNPAGNNSAVPRLEPQSGGTVQPGAMNDDQLSTWARAEAAKQPGYATMTQKEREELFLEISSRKKWGGR